MLPTRRPYVSTRARIENDALIEQGVDGGAGQSTRERAQIVLQFSWLGKGKARMQSIAISGPASAVA